jgi:hypothetical protein
MRFAPQSGMYARIPSHFSPELEDIIKQLLAQDPKRRPSADTLLARPSVLRRRQELGSVLDGTLKAAIADEEVDMLATIQVPRNIKRITNQLPAPCYPDTRPHSPISWPVADPRRVRACCRLLVCTAACESSLGDSGASPPHCLLPANLDQS